MSGNNLEAMLSIGAVRYGDNLTEEEINTNTRLDKLENQNAGERLSYLEDANSVNEERITFIEGLNLGDRVTTLEDSDHLNTSKIKTLENINADERISILEDINADKRIDILEDINADKRIDILEKNTRRFEQLSDEIINKMVEAVTESPYCTIEPITSGSNFYIDTSIYKEYTDYYADRYKVRLKANLSVVNSSYSGSDEYLFTIPSQFVPTWAFEEGSEFIEFTQAYSYKKTGDVTTSTMRNYCRVKMFKNGQLKVDGTVALSDTITRLDLFLDIEYRRDVV